MNDERVLVDNAFNALVEAMQQELEARALYAIEKARHSGNEWAILQSFQVYSSISRFGADVRELARNNVGLVRLAVLKGNLEMLENYLRALPKKEQ